MTDIAKLQKSFVNQLAGDPDHRNTNCGFVSSLMALRVLDLPDPNPLTSVGGDDNYQKAMNLRALGGAGSNDSTWGTSPNVVSALTAAGAQAEIVTNTWGADKLAAAKAMEDVFLNSMTPTAFVIAGNPAMGWPNLSPYNGGHFVTVAGFDPITGTFQVLDPVAAGPIDVDPEQIAGYLKASNAEASEVIKVTP